MFSYLKRAIVVAIHRSTGLYLITSDEFERLNQKAPSTNEMAELTNLRMLQDIVNEHAFGLKRTAESAAVLKKISQDWQKARSGKK